MYEDLSNASDDKLRKIRDVLSDEIRRMQNDLNAAYERLDEINQRLEPTCYITTYTGQTQLRVANVG